MKIKRVFKKDFTLIKSKGEYKKARIKYIAGYKTWRPGGFLTSGADVEDPQAGKAQWDKMFPNGYDDWITSYGDKLSTWGQQKLIDKVNEIIKVLNNKVLK